MSFYVFENGVTSYIRNLNQELNASGVTLVTASPITTVSGVTSTNVWIVYDRSSETAMTPYYEYDTIVNNLILNDFI